MGYTGAGDIPVVIDITKELMGPSNAGVTQNQFTGNKILLQRMKFDMWFVPYEGQGTVDNVIMRVSMVQLKQSYDFQPVSGGWDAYEFCQQLYLHTPTSSVDAWPTYPLDRTKVRVLYDKVKIRHATPQTTSTQVFCHFPMMRFKIVKKWARGKIMQLNRANPVSNNLTNMLNPILIILQAGDHGVTVPPSPILTTYATISGSMYLSWRDL